SPELGPPAILATIDETPYTITEDSVRSQLQLADDGGIDDLPIAEIYSGMDNLGYVTEGKLTFYKNKFSPQWRFLVHTILHCLSTKSSSWDQFGSSLVVALICLSDGRKFNWSSYIFKGMVSNIGNAKKFLMYPRFLQTILGIETSLTRQYKVFKLSSKLFANMKLNFEGQPMQLLAAMLPQDQDGESAGVAAQAVPPPISEPVAEPMPEPDQPQDHLSTPPRQQTPPASPPRSTQAPPAGHTSGGAEDLITLTALSFVVSTLVQKVNSLETELKAHKKLFKDVVGKLVKKVKAMEVKLKTKKRKVVVSDSDQEEGGEQAVDLDALIALANAAVTVDSNIPPGGASNNPAASSHIPTDVPTGGDFAPAHSTSPSRDPFKGKGVAKPSSPISERTKKQLADEKLSEIEAARLEALERERFEKEKRETRQEEVLSSAKHYSDADWIDIMAQVHANAGLSSELLGADVNDDNFAERMVALINQRKRAFAEQTDKEKRDKPMTPAQQREYMRVFVKNQSTTIYSTGWSMKYVKSLTDEQLIAEFEKIRMAVADLKSHKLRRTLKRAGEALEPDTSKKSRITKPKSILTELDLDADDKTFIKVVSDEDSEDEAPILWSAFAGWEVISTPLGEINALYMMDQSTKHFTTLREILHMVDRQDLLKLYRLVVKYYENHPVAGAGLVLWGDLQVLMDSQAGGKGSLVWNHQSYWQIQSWRLYTLSNVHVLETVSGEVLYMFSNVSYPLSVKLMESMLTHKLEIEKDVFNKATKTSHYMVIEGVLMKHQDAAFSRDIQLICAEFSSIQVKPQADWMYVVPTGRVVVPTGRYVVPAGKVIIIVSTGRLSLVPTGRVLSPGRVK
ncbi:hypothetical protein Tco_1575803, partial [Tanacetum coccineum]